MQASPTNPQGDNKTPAKVGRPSVMTSKVENTIIERMMSGESLNAICQSPEMPGRSTVMRHIAKDSIFQAKYTRAREALVEHWADELLEIADDGTLDTIPGTNKHGEEVQVSNPSNVQRDRLRVDSRKWLMSKLTPKKYGDRVDVDVSGEVVHVAVSSLSDREKARRWALFMVEDQQAAASGVVIEGEVQSVQTLPNKSDASL